MNNNKRKSRCVTEFSYIGLGNELWSCYHCKTTTNITSDKKCAVCNEVKGSKPKLHWSNWDKNSNLRKVEK